MNTQDHKDRVKRRLNRRREGYRQQDGRYKAKIKSCDTHLFKAILRRLKIFYKNNEELAKELDIRLTTLENFLYTDEITTGSASKILKLAEKWGVE